MKTHFDISCPCCGHKHKVTTDTTAGKELVDCDPMEGGCDSFFVVEYSTKVETKIRFASCVEVQS